MTNFFSKPTVDAVSSAPVVIDDVSVLACVAGGGPNGGWRAGSIDTSPKGFADSSTVDRFCFGPNGGWSRT